VTREGGVVEALGEHIARKKERHGVDRKKMSAPAEKSGRSRKTGDGWCE
jgi:hypothetical protein